MNLAQSEPQPITFDEALDQTIGRTRYLFLGNGFSMSARSSFSYSSLYHRAGKFSPAIASLFTDLKTEDFELVLSAIRTRRDGGSSSSQLGSDILEQEAEVRAGFLRALSKVHPDSSMLMGHEECEKCAEFLEHFVGRRRPWGKRGRIYTTNYDLLLYWVIARAGRRLVCYDSHFSPVAHKRYGVWHSEKAPDLVYLHGALHTYNFGRSQGMLRYDGKLSLIEQTRMRLDQGKYPVFVAEGRSEDKVARIYANAYLTWASRYLRSGLRNKNGALFTFGHSLSGRDAHLLRRVGQGRIPAVYIGAWGGLAGGQRQAIESWAQEWWRARCDQSQFYPLEIRVFDSSTFSPWK